jgi:protein phosphatase 1G
LFFSFYIINSDAFVVLACDGIWDVMSSQDVINFLGDKLGYTESALPTGGITAEQAVQACDDLLELCMCKEVSAYDNLSVLIIILGDPGKHIISMSSRSSLETHDEKDPNSIKRLLFK